MFYGFVWCLFCLGGEGLAGGVRVVDDFERVFMWRVRVLLGLVRGSRRRAVGRRRVRRVARGG